MHNFCVRKNATLAKIRTQLWSIGDVQGMATA
jgi:hypothetical protein